MGRLLLLLFGLVLLLACSHVGHGWTMSGGGTSIPQSPVTRRGRLVKMQISASAGHRAVDFLDPREIARPSLQVGREVLLFD